MLLDAALLLYMGRGLSVVLVHIGLQPVRLALALVYPVLTAGRRWHGLLLGRKTPEVAREMLWVLSAIALGALAIVWILGLQTSTEQARVAFLGLPAIAVLVALGYEKLGLSPVLRFCFPRSD